ncbi:MAG: hypothetical protein O9346_02215 [Leptospiraceae bacterium]|nr:hypothetical protein [Leptospiraceae bacterium]MCZ8345207.1 hypothetical protein [Leptospiraceae bacterium]PJE04286.1 MAG: hypothetical protein CK427_03095 [Leptospira sp.]
MNQKLIIFLLIFISFFHCNLGKDKSNDPLELLARLLVRLSLNGSAINPELPSNVSVPVPRSIRKADAGLALSSKQFSAKDFNNLISTNNTGIGILQEGSSVISKILQDSKRDLVLISPVYSIAKGSPGVCIPGGRARTEIGQAAIDEILEGLMRLGLSKEEAETELISLQGQGILPRIGQSIPTPAIVYRVSSERSYNHEVSFSFSDSITVPKTCPSNINSKTAFDKTIRWNNDKSQIFSFIQKSIKVLNIDITINASVTYFTSADKKDRSVLQTKLTTKQGSNNASEVSKTLTVEECSLETDENTNNCVSLNYKSKEKKSSTITVDTNINGRTDNEGGRAITTIQESGTGASTIDIEIYESFDPNGNITWIEYYENGVFTNGFGTDDGDYTFDENNLFDGFIELTLDLGCVPGNCIGDTTFDEYDVFVIVYTGDDPTIDENIIGYGIFEDDGGMDGYTILDETFIVYYGDDIDNPSTELTVWRIEIDGNDDIIYTEMDDTLSFL